MSSATVPFLDLAVSQAALHPDLDDAWRTVTRSARYVGGPVVERFEGEWARTCGSTHAIGVGNGTDALEVVLRALGVGPGDEVVVPDNTFIATAEAVLAVGATPHFVDVDPTTLLVTASSVEAAVNPRTVAVIVVHLYGQAADMDALTQVAARRGLALVEDCAQAQGARWRGRPVGSFGVAGCTSFYPGKNLGAFGDGGAVVTSDEALARRIRQLGDHGRDPVSKYEHPLVGRNSRLDALQAGVLLVKLPHLESWNAQRREAAARYADRLSHRPDLTLVGQADDSTSVHHLHVVRVDHRDEVRERLAGRGVETAVHYPVPCHQQGGYARLPHSDLAVSTGAAPRLLSLPMFPGITEEQIDVVSQNLLEVLDATRQLQTT